MKVKHDLEVAGSPHTFSRCSQVTNKFSENCAGFLSETAQPAKTIKLIKTETDFRYPDFAISK
jgi:hypothetical protein